MNHFEASVTRDLIPRLHMECWVDILAGLFLWTVGVLTVFCDDFYHQKSVCEILFTSPWLYLFLLLLRLNKSDSILILPTFSVKRVTCQSNSPKWLLSHFLSCPSPGLSWDRCFLVCRVCSVQGLDGWASWRLELDDQRIIKTEKWTGCTEGCMQTWLQRKWKRERIYSVKTWSFPMEGGGSWTCEIWEQLEGRFSLSAELQGPCKNISSTCNQARQNSEETYSGETAMGTQNSFTHPSLNISENTIHLCTLHLKQIHWS